MTSDWAWVSGWPLVMDQLSLSIFSSNMMVVARALQWAFLASVSSFWPKCLTSPSMGSCFASGESLQILMLPIPSVAYPPSASGSFSKRTPCPSSIHLPFPAHMVEIWTISWVYILGNRGPWSLLCWYGAPLTGWQRCLPVGLNTGGCAVALVDHSFHLPSSGVSGVKKHFLENQGVV